MTRVMGVLNVTPDSFSDGGQFECVDTAVARAEEMVRQGAHVVDVGGESTRPGAVPVPLEVELRRVLPVVEAIGSRCVVSIDTSKNEVARQCIRAGAQIVNDVSGQLWPLAAEHGAGWVVVHMQGLPSTMQRAPTYRDVTGEVLEYLLKTARTARAAGVRDVWIDPGIGFGKNLEHNLALLRDLPVFVQQEFPVLLGASRKSFIHQLAVAADPAERVPGSLAAAAFATLAGVDMLRVHDVAETLQAVRVVAALRRPGDDEVMVGGWRGSGRHG